MTHATATQERPHQIRTTSQRLGARVLIFVLALACAAVAGPFFARTVYDGDWSVLIVSHDGVCAPAFRYCADRRWNRHQRRRQHGYDARTGDPKRDRQGCRAVRQPMGRRLRPPRQEPRRRRLERPRYERHLRRHVGRGTARIGPAPLLVLFPQLRQLANDLPSILWRSAPGLASHGIILLQALDQPAARQAWGRIHSIRG
jgi:hypothetical protein